MPIIHVSMLKGRTVEQKREFAKVATEKFAEICGSAGTVQLVYHEVEREDWAVAGTLIIDKSD